MKGHLLALFTILIWGTTFVSSKVLLKDFSPIEILFYRFVIGFIVLSIIYPKRLKNTSIKQELTFALAGLSGILLYYLLENIALTYTSVSNVGVIVSIIPFFTAVLSKWILSSQSTNSNFYIGFIISIFGICLISFNGNIVLKLNPLGDFLALIASIAWAFYSILSKKISEFGFHTIQTTRRIFFYGLLFMIPVLFVNNFNWGIERFFKTTNLLNILFLGLFASAICFVTWNTSVKILGAVKTSIYIYMVPVITIIASLIILKEQTTWISIFGACLTLIGLLISQKKYMKFQRRIENEHRKQEMCNDN